jgi:phage tail-like protein
MTALAPQPPPNFNFFISLTPAMTPGMMGPSSVPASTLPLALQAPQFVIGGFSECSGLNLESETETYQEGGYNLAPLRFTKWGKHPSIVLKKGITFGTAFWDWYTQQLATGGGGQIRMNGLVLLLDRGPAQGPPGTARVPVAGWVFLNGFPEKVQGPTLSARGNDVAFESIEIVHDGLMRLSPATLPGLGEVAAGLGVSLAT